MEPEHAASDASTRAAHLLGQLHKSEVAVKGRVIITTVPEMLTRQENEWARDARMKFACKLCRQADGTITTKDIVGCDVYSMMAAQPKASAKDMGCR